MLSHQTFSDRYSKILITLKATPNASAITIHRRILWTCQEGGFVAPGYFADQYSIDREGDRPVPASSSGPIVSERQIHPEQS